MHIKEVTEHFDLERIVPFFQPIMDLEQNCVWRFECLARLVTPGEQTFLPSDFLHIVERQQSVKQLTQTIFSRSAEYFRELNVAWSINISEDDLLNPGFVQGLMECLSVYPNPHRVSLEITASVALNHLAVFEQFANQCLNLKIGLFIDHFGATSGNIKRILALPITGIKVAGSLINQLISDPPSYEFVEYLTQQAQQKNMAVVAVHVEDKATMERIKDIGIRYAQGFYFSMPQPTTD